MNKEIKGNVERKYFACAVDVGEAGSPKYVVLGYHIEEAGLELNAEITKGKDINGRNFSSIDKFEPSMTFDAMPLTMGDEESEMHGLLSQKLIRMFREDDLAGFSNFKTLLIYGFDGSEGAYSADLYDKTSIVPSSIGGADWTEVSFEISFGGNKTLGTVDKLIDEVEFTPEAPEA